MDIEADMDRDLDMNIDNLDERYKKRRQWKH
jgi:hypothetical protein